jgi:hypothetical protein
MRRAILLLVLLLIAAMPLRAAERRMWAYEEGAYTLASGQEWEHVHEDTKFAFHEVGRTDQYIELERNDDNRKRIRLFEDHAEWRGPGDTVFSRTLDGKWQ